ncbi:MAG: leucine-rich repeat domain-containing protein, partial [Oscillospiraceae bacterium]|nr:leucine-rich repeat domain-containing protein [Oscillospiraceae bacterium]
GVTSIGNFAFSGCGGLTSIHVAENNPNYRSLDGVLFSRDMTALLRYPAGRQDLEYGIPEGVTSIGYGAFNGCSSLTSITIPEGVTSIGDFAFSGCGGLTGIIVEENNPSYRSLDGVLFSKDLTVLLVYPAGKQDPDYVIPEGVSSVGSGAFEGCSGLTEVTLPEGVTSIGDSAFADCSGLTEITIPEGVTSIGNFAFAYCSGLTAITIPEGVTSINNAAFFGCSGLTEVAIPESVTSIGDGAFYGCDSLTQVRYAGTAEDWERIEGGGKTDIPADILFFGEDDSGEPLSGACGDDLRWELDDEGNLSIRGAGAMWDYSRSGDNTAPWGREIKTLTLDTGVTSIGDRAFYGCSGLTAITIPEGVASIGDSAFAYCSGLTSITIPEGVASIGEGAFFGCSGLTTVTIPDSVTSIGSYAFQDCSGLTTVTIPDSVTSIGEGAFAGCGSLTSVVFPAGLRSIGSFAFSVCSSLRQIILPSGLTRLGSGVFSGCSALESVTLPGYAGIVDGLFQNCTALREVRFSNGVTSIGSFAFSGCTNLRKVWLPRSVRTIVEKAFNDCEKLDDVYYSGSPENWAAMAIGSYNSFLTTAEIHYGENPAGEVKADIVGSRSRTEGGQTTFDVTVYCEPETAATALGVRYSAEGQCLGLTMVTLAPGEETRMAIPCEDGTFLRIFALDSATCAPLTATLNLEA